MTTKRDLFGGAITIILPTGLVDASDLRQVPDTQEVFLYPDSGTSIIVEVLERVAADYPADAARFHFDSLAHDNSATRQNVQSVEVSTNRQGETPAPIILHGTQSIPKFNRPTPDDVQIHLALYRVESKNVDLVLSMNVPTKTSESGAVTAEGAAAAQRDFETAVSSLKILDYGLFA